MAATTNLAFANEAQQRAQLVQCEIVAPKKRLVHLLS
jgi:hypothetical protein